MNEQQKIQPEPQPFKSLGAIVAGFLATAITTTLVDTIMHQTGVFPDYDVVMSSGLFGLALAYRVVLNSFGCMIAAKLAPYYPMYHAFALGTFGMIMAGVGAYVMWDKGPAWYSIANILIALPCAWIGGKLYERQRSKLQK
jgi:hypothetical protein